MYTISLNNLEFHSFHGFYQEENLIGNTFVVDIVVEINDFELGIRNEELGIENIPTFHVEEELGLTVNYETLFQIAKEEMAIPRKLLETVVKSIYDRIKLLNPNIHSIEVSLTKKHVPIEGMIGNARVTYKN
jgi:dihydroneopterin aldolase